jgi:hypothetical protein
MKNKFWHGKCYSIDNQLPQINQASIHKKTQAKAPPEKWGAFLFCPSPETGKFVNENSFCNDPQKYFLTYQ